MRVFHIFLNTLELIAVLVKYLKPVNAALFFHMYSKTVKFNDGKIKGNE